MKCKYCTFDSESDSIYAEGAPCGFNGCHTYTCCMESWYDHVLKAHKLDYRKKGDTT